MKFFEFEHFLYSTTIIISQTKFLKIVDKLDFILYNKHRKRQDLKRLCQDINVIK